MALLALLCAGLLSHARPTQATFVFELAGAPVGTVQLEQSATHFRYTSTQFFLREGHRDHARRSVQLPLSQRPIPSALWLWQRPAPGCVQGWEELSARPIKLCALTHARSQVEGTVDGRPFSARYDEGGQLSWLRLGVGRFRRVTVPPSPAPEDFFAKGFPIDGERGPLTLHPPRSWTAPPLKPWSGAKARALAERVHASFVEKRPAESDLGDEEQTQVGSCLAHARRFVRWAAQQGGQARVVYGLLALEGRAHPHAWVEVATRAGRMQLDPTSLDPVAPHTHLELGPEGQAGEAYLQLWQGRGTVRRHPTAQPPLTPDRPAAATEFFHLRSR